MNAFYMHNRVLVFAAKLQDASFDHIPSASRPSSPDTQLAAPGAEQGAGELTKEEAEVYNNYIQNQLSEDNIELMSKEHLDRIK